MRSFGVREKRSSVLQQSRCDSPETAAVISMPLDPDFTKGNYGRLFHINDGRSRKMSVAQLIAALLHANFGNVILFVELI